MPVNPCRACDRGGKTKNHARCRDCGARIDYLAALEQGCECRADPVYQSAYSIPRMFTRQLGPVRSFSMMDLIPF